MNKAVSSLEVLQSVSDAITEMVSRATPSVVTVSNGMGRGSGVVWSSDGYVVTCSHVVGRRGKVTVGLADGKKYEARVVGQDPYSDVALLKVEGSGFEPIGLGDSEKTRVGEFVLAVANAFYRQPSATSGIVTSVGGSLRRWGVTSVDNVIVTDAQLNPGYSGGPLLNVSGKMIGLNMAYVWSRGIAVPISTVKHVVDSLKSEGKVKRAYLGILADTISLPDEIATREEVGQDGGVLVHQVEAGSAARKAGLALGDIVIKFNGKPVTNIYDLHAVLTDEVAGKETKIAILRGEKLIELKVTPSTAPDNVKE